MENYRLYISICILVFSVHTGFSQIDTLEKHLSDDYKIYGLSLLWKEASYNFAYFDYVPSLDWDKRYQEYLGKVRSTKSVVDYYDLLRQFYALLNHHHSFVYPPNEYWEFFDQPKLKVINIQKHVIVENVGESLKDLIPIGSEILKVNDIPTIEYLKERIFPLISASREDFLWESGLLELLRGKKGATIEITYSTPKGEVKSAKLKCNSKQNDESWVRPINTPINFEFKWLENDLAYIALNTFDDDKITDEFINKLSEIKKGKGLIIDLRKNAGGSSEIAFSIIKYLIDKPIPTFKLKARSSISIYKAWGNWGRTEYSNPDNDKSWLNIGPDTIRPADDNIQIMPIVVLVGNTGSAAEDFLVTIKQLKNVTLVGKTSAGCTGAPFIFDLPGGGLGLITTSKEISMDGNDTRNGIKPDIEVIKTFEDIINDRDPVLKKATEVFKP
jgi:carboxyl-terminal processing protease